MTTKKLVSEPRGSITSQGCRTPELCNAGAGEVDGACQLCDGEEWLAVLTPRDPETHLCPRCFHSREKPGSPHVSKVEAWEAYKKRVYGQPTNRSTN